MKKVLILMTNHATLGETNEANGTYAPELTHVVHELKNANIGFDLASISGGNAPLYGTDTDDDPINKAWLDDEQFLSDVSNTHKAVDLNIDDYDAIFYPGGYGLLSDLAENEDVAKLSAKHYENGGLLAAVCHGPAGLLPIVLENGDKLLASKTVTGFSREEEIDSETIDKVPFLLEESLARNSKQYNKVQPWNEFVVEDARVVTGQNPGSAGAVGKAIVAHLTS